VSTGNKNEALAGEGLLVRMYRSDDGDLRLLAGKVVSILGYGNQGGARRRISATAALRSLR
jgi:hypothetical protein